MFSISRAVLFILVALSVSCQQSKKQLPYYNTPDFSPLFIDRIEDVDKVVTHRIESFEFSDQHDKIISLNTVRNKIHVVDFFFTSCGNICPVMTGHMERVSKAFEKDSSIVLLSFSVTPWIDDVKTLNEYAKSNHINNPNWHLLTGNKSAIYKLARQSYFAEESIGFSKDSTEFLHTEHFLLVDSNQRIRGIYNGTLALDVQQLIEDIKVLKEE